MGRPSKKTEATAPVEAVEEPIVDAPVEEKVEEPKEEYPGVVLEAMKLYPQYEKIWITKEGFVHPDPAPKYLIEGAKLYTNKYYEK